MGDTGGEGGRGEGDGEYGNSSSIVGARDTCRGALYIVQVHILFVHVLTESFSGSDVCLDGFLRGSSRFIREGPDSSTAATGSWGRRRPREDLLGERAGERDRVRGGSPLRVG